MKVFGTFLVLVASGLGALWLQHQEIGCRRDDEGCVPVSFLEYHLMPSHQWKVPTPARVERWERERKMERLLIQWGVPACGILCFFGGLLLLLSGDPRTTVVHGDEEPSARLGRRLRGRREKEAAEDRL
jgi:hypothetical protein